MSSHRASGKDHSPSSIQVRMLLLPGRQSGRVSRAMSPPTAKITHELPEFEPTCSPQGFLTGSPMPPSKNSASLKSTGQLLHQTDMEARLSPCLLCVKIPIICASYATQEKAPFWSFHHPLALQMCVLTEDSGTHLKRC